MTDRDVPPLAYGDFVWTNFPFQSEPDKPGPLRHVAFVIATFTRRAGAHATNASIGKSGLVVGVYTSSQIHKFGGKIPSGVVPVEGVLASRAGGQKPFFIDTRVRAFIPFDEAFFPLIHEASRGLVGRASEALRNEVLRSYGDVNRRRAEQIVNLGPLRPR